ncbi:MAG: RNA methyltransferase [Defluviitaleaceae bacterium]|nr:RNA methyltransferase [Defluviitaleaceae bacterium]
MNDVVVSAENRFVKEVSLLRSAKQRRKLGKFTLEGAAYIFDIPDTRHVEYMLVAESRRGEYRALLEKHSHRIVADKLMALLCDTVTPQGVIAVCKQPRHNTLQLVARGGLYVICEDVRDPGNLGTIIRTAEAAGATAVLALCGCTDVYSPKAVRASSGAVFQLPVAEDLAAEDVMALLRGNNTRVYATHLDGGSLPYDVDLRGNCAIIIGNEAHGVSDDLARQCDARIKLPMPGTVQSLNASVAAGVIIYESLRQRLYH